MSARMAAEARKRLAEGAPAWRNSRQSDQPAVSLRTDDLHESDEISPHSAHADASLGHDLSKISIHRPTSSTEKDGQRVPESCPLEVSNPRTCPFGGACHKCPETIQNKLAIDQPGDQYEQEADQVAEQVMRMAVPVMQRKKGCPAREEDEEPVQAKTLSGAGRATGEALEPGVEAARRTGQPLDPVVRAFFEPRFGYDFSRVRVHTGAEAEQSARDVNAHAYTVGNNIVFGINRFAPESNNGRKLIAHELTHIVQQNGKVPVVRRKKLKTPYRAQIVSVKESGGTVQACQDVNATGCRTDVLTPGMEVTITVEFVGGVWLFAQNLPEVAVKALYGQKWIYVPAKYILRLPEAKAQPAPKPKAKSETKTEADARIEQLLNAIYSRDNEKVAALLNEGGLDEALDLMRRVQENAEAKGQISPVGYLGDDFSLDASDERSLRVAMTAYTIKLSIGDFSGSVSDAYDALNAAAKRLGFFAQGSVDGYLRSHAGDDVKSVVEQRMTEQVGEFVEQYEQIKAVEKDPLGVFQKRLKAKTLQVLDENEAAVKKQRKALSGKESADEAWKRLETVVVPQAILYAQLGTLEEKLSSLVTHTTKALKYAEEGADDLAGIEYSEERGEPAYDDWWRPHKFPMGGGGANYPPPIDNIRAELEEDRKRLASVQEQRGYVKNRFPLAKALRPALLEKLAKGPASKDVADVNEFRRSVFLDLEKQVFEVALTAIAQLRDDVEGGVARLYSFTPLVDEVKSELMLGPDQEAKIDAWIEEQKSRTETILVVTSALSIALLPLMFVPGGQLVVAIVGLLSGAYGADVVGEEYTAAKAGSAGKEIVEKSPEDMRWEVNLALLDLVLSGLDVGSAVKALSKTGRVAKVAKRGEEIAEETRRAAQTGGKGAESGDVAKLKQKKITDVEEGIRKGIIRGEEVKAEERAAWKAVFRPPAVLRMVIVPGAEEFGRFVYAVYLTVKRGIRDFQVFVKTNEAIDLIGDISKLKAEELATLKTSYRKAIEEMKTVAAHGKALGMAENDIDAFMKLRGETKWMSVDQVMAEMNTFKGTGLSVEVTEKQWARLRRVSEALNDESKWINVSPKDRWRLGRVYDNLLEKLVSEGVKRTGQVVMHYVELNAELVKNLRSAGKRVLITEGRLPSEGLRFDMLEIDFVKGRAELIDLTATSSARHLEKTRSGKVALEKLLGMPADAKELYYAGPNGELLETLVEVTVK
jgi:hypothetical protein